MLYRTFSSILTLLLASRGSYATPSNTSSQIQWGPCDPTVSNGTSVSCGFLDVPLDYHDPSVGNARLALLKVNATGERRGSVFFNPGGPGDSGVSNLGLPGLQQILQQYSGGVYDIVSWDPRGVGLTVPGELYCFDSIEDYTAHFNGTIELTGIEETGNFTDPADVQALLAQGPSLQKKYDELGQKCLNSTNGKYLKYLGTAAAVRDMVSIANVLDGPDAPINYIGISYGSLIGSWFVGMFPERVGKVVIDGILNPVGFGTQKPSAYFAAQLENSDTVYKGLITGCALSGPAGCPIASEGDGPLDIDSKFQALIKAAHEATKANASVPLTSGVLRVELFAEMYAPADWSRFLNETFPQWQQIISGEAPANGSLARRADDFVRRNPLMRRASSNNTSLSYSSHAVTCGDAIDMPGLQLEDQFKDVINTARNVSHIFGTYWPAPIYQCPYWPVRSVERYEGSFNKTLANKIIVASNVYDPITPLTAAEVIASRIGDDAVLLRLNGFGHSTIAEPSICTVNAVAAYFVNGTLPANNTLCEVEPAAFELFPGVTTADIIAHLPSFDV
ncbi:alpha/beta-hydrolase [Polyporus arcularius HHB13444]|uniref:Alpha/beta-hydrolase n=1 Tax=Polyporus arcularius HHB13444 TaxID=1314778 RepID=A0A5C3PC03_9APHY|nr:alpha/beta-hydrolase [Polyporus arcularius HHB13444]